MGVPRAAPATRAGVPMNSGGLGGYTTCLPALPTWQDENARGAVGDCHARGLDLALQERIRAFSDTANAGSEPSQSEG